MAGPICSELALEILEALKIPSKGIRVVDIRLHVNEVATITIERFLDRDELGLVSSIFEKYQVIAKE